MWQSVLHVTKMFDRDYCPFCDEPVQHLTDDYIDECQDHGVLEGITDEEWVTILSERGW